MAFLQQGGLTASVSEGSTCTVNVPNGGTLLHPGHRGVRHLQPGDGVRHRRQLQRHGQDQFGQHEGSDARGRNDGGHRAGRKAPRPIHCLSVRKNFNRIITEVGSPIDTIKILRDMYGIPQPEQQPQSLFTYEGDKMVPGLALDWTTEGTIDSGMEAWTFFLNKDLLLENGEPLTAPLVAKVIMETASPKALRGVEIFPMDDFAFAIQFFQGADRSLLQELPMILFNIKR